MKFVLIVFLCGLVAASAFHVPRDVAAKRAAVQIKQVKKSILEDGLKTVFNQIMNILAKGGDLTIELVNNLQGIVNTIAHFSIELSRDVMELVEKVAKDATGHLKTVLDQLIESQNKLKIRMQTKQHIDIWNPIEVALNGIFNLIETALKKGQELSEDLLKTLRTTVDSVINTGVKLSKGLMDTVESLANKITGEVKVILDKLIDAQKKIRNSERAIEFDLEKTLEDIVQKLKDGLDKGKDTVLDLQQKLKEVLQKMKDAHIDVKTKIDAVLQNLKDKTKGIIQGILDKLQEGLK